jgi:hypothetical protein
MKPDRRMLRCPLAFAIVKVSVKLFLAWIPQGEATSLPLRTLPFQLEVADI